jgi:glycerol kinase
MVVKKHKNSSGIAALPMIKPEKKDTVQLPDEALYQIASGKQERDYAMEAKVIVAGASIYLARELYDILHKLFKN